MQIFAPHIHKYRKVTLRIPYKIIAAERIEWKLSILHECTRPPSLIITRITFGAFIVFAISISFDSKQLVSKVLGIVTES